MKGGFRDAVTELYISEAKKEDEKKVAEAKANSAFKDIVTEAEFKAMGEKKY